MFTKSRLIVIVFSALVVFAMVAAANAAGCPKMAGKANCGMVCPTDCPQDCKLCPNPGNCSGPCMKSCTKASACTNAQMGSKLSLTVHEALGQFAGQSLAIVK